MAVTASNMNLLPIDPTRERVVWPDFGAGGSHELHHLVLFRG